MITVVGFFWFYHRIWHPDTKEMIIEMNRVLNPPGSFKLQDYNVVSSRQPDKKKTNPFLGQCLLDHSNGAKNRKVFHVKTFFPSVPVWECSYSTLNSLCSSLRWRFWLIFSRSYHSVAGRVNLISSLKNGNEKDFRDKESVYCISRYSICPLMTGVWC